MLQGNGIFFTDQTPGYDKRQVDSYIQKLTAEYTALQEQHSKLAAAYQGLNNQCSAAQAPPPHPGADVIAKALIDAETTAGRIIDDAQNEAARIVGGAQEEYRQMQAEQHRLHNEIGCVMDRLRGAIPTNWQAGERNNNVLYRA